ncbi:MAG TPA: hypothetical protein VGE52_22280, partial [Pirellulales bacterium]
MLFAAWIWQPAFEPGAIACGAVALAALAVSAYLRAPLRGWARGVLLAMRLLGVAGLAILLLGPSRLPPSSSGDRRPTLDVLVDVSQSMLVDDASVGSATGRSRLGAALSTWLSPDALRRVEQDYVAELQGFDAELRSLPYLGDRPAGEDEALAQRLATGQQTRLAGSLSTALSDASGGDGASLLVLSDGRDTDDADVQATGEIARRRGIPIHAVAFGSPRFQKDLAVFASTEQDYLLPREPGSIKVKVYQTGLNETSTTVRLKHGNEERQSPVAFGPNRVVEVSLPIQHDEPGSYEYTVSVDADAGELEQANNQQTVFCEVAPKRIKVLALEGKPFWDAKFLAQALRKDDRLELTQITQVSPDKRETITTRVEGAAPSVPQTADDWAAYDVVILGQGFERLATPESAAALTTYVDRGGCVIFSRGRPYRADQSDDETARALRAIEPVVWGEETVRNAPLEPTAAGRVSPWLSPSRAGIDAAAALERLPAPTTLTIAERVKPGALVLLQSASGPGNPQVEPPAPAVVSMSYGQGTVVGVLGEGLWKWSLSVKKGDELAGFYDAFWSNLVRWLALGGEFQPGRPASLQLSKTRLRVEEPLSIDVVCRTEPPNGLAPTLTWIAPDGARRELALTRTSGRDPRWRATIQPTETGVYNVEAAVPGLTTEMLVKRVQVYDLNVERLDVSADPARLALLAEQSGGKLYGPGEFDQFLNDLRRERAASIAPARPEFIWDRWEVMTILLFWLGFEWIF